MVVLAGETVAEVDVITLKSILVGVAALCLPFSCATAEPIKFDERAFLAEFELAVANGTDGEVFKSLDHEGKVFVMEFYFNGCPACNQNAPKFEQLYEAYKSSSKVVFLNLGVDCDEDQYTAWIRKHKPQFKVLVDCGDTVTDGLRVTRFPTVVFVGKDRIEKMRKVGVWSSGDMATFKSFLDKEVQ